MMGRTFNGDQVVRAVGVSWLVFFVATSARATVLLPAGLDDISRRAQAIARGRVTSVKPRWTDDHRRIETVVTLDADVYLKGELGSLLQFTVPGGQLGRYRSITVGAPTLVPGARVIVFLGSRGPSLPWVVGLAQGVFLIVQSGGAWVVTPPVILPVVGAAVPVVRGDPTRRPTQLADFERQVRALAGSLP